MVYSNQLTFIYLGESYKQEDIIPLAMNRDLWKALCDSM